MKIKYSILIISCIWISKLTSLAQDYTQTQNRIKAIYAYNFIKEVKQPDFRKDGDILLCLMVKNGFYEELKKRIESKIVDGRNLKINLIENISECVNCDMIFIDEELGGKNFTRKEDCKSFIVTIGFYEKSLSNIALVYQENKLQFGINTPLCDKFGYKIASELANLSNKSIIDSK